MKGVEAAQVLQVDREEEDATKEGEGDERVGDVTRQEWPVAKHTQIEQRLLAVPRSAQFDNDETAQNKSASEQRGEYFDRTPAIAAGIRQSIQHGRQAHRSQHKARHIEARAYFRAHFAQEQDGKYDAQDADWHVDKEDQLPIHVAHKVPTQRWANGGSQQGRDSEQPTGQPALLWRKFAIQHGDSQGKETGSAHSLHNAEEDQHGQAPRQPTERRTGCKNGERDDIKTLCAETISKVGGRWRDDTLRENIGGEYPLYAIEIRIEGYLQARNGDIDDGLIQNTHERAEDDDQGDNPLVSETRTTWYRRS